MQLIGPGTQEEKENWHEVAPTTLADCTGSKPCTPRPHLLSGPKKNTCFFLCSFSQYEDGTQRMGKKEKKKNLSVVAPSCMCLSSNFIQACGISSFITVTFCQK